METSTSETSIHLEQNQILSTSIPTGIVKQGPDMAFNDPNLEPPSKAAKQGIPHGVVKPGPDMAFNDPNLEPPSKVAEQGIPHGVVKPGHDMAFNDSNLEPPSNVSEHSVPQCVVKRGHDMAFNDSNFEPPSNAEHSIPRSLPPFPPKNRQGARRSPTHPPAGQDGTHISASAVVARTAVPVIPGPCQDTPLSLADPRYGFPSSLIKNFAQLGVRGIYPCQAPCLFAKDIFQGHQNLIYSALTGRGKSLVAQVLLLKKVIQQPSQKGILVVPYVALGQEKLWWLRKLVEGVSKNTDCGNVQHVTTILGPQRTGGQDGIRVAGFFPGSRTNATWADLDIAVCTIEEANSLVNSAWEEGKIHQLGLVVLDEMRMLYDENRGYPMELLITKLLGVQHHMQIVGISDILSNPEPPARWIQGKYIVFNRRPVPVEEFIVYENAVYPTASQLGSPLSAQKLPMPARTIERSPRQELQDPTLNAVVSLSVETAQWGFGTLVFCGSGQACETTALLICEAISVEHTPLEIIDMRLNLMAALQALIGGFDPVLLTALIVGVAVHHAGLTIEERQLIAEAYGKGILQVVCTTCHLGAGINLPARRVILNGARMGRDIVGPAMLRHMRGQAGRKGKDEFGEIFLCCEKADLELLAERLQAEMPPFQSWLTPEKHGVKRALLEGVAIRRANARLAMYEYIKCSLLYQTTDPTVVLRTVGMVEEAIEGLLQTKLIQAADSESFEPTKLGQAVVAASLSPEDGLAIHRDMQRASESVVMDREMHVFYLLTPVQPTGATEIRWPVFRDQLDRLDSRGKRALRCVGVNPAFVHRLANCDGDLRDWPPEERNRSWIYRRAYSAFQLRDLCNEEPFQNISLRYSVPRGDLQNLVLTCHRFGAGMVKFCERMGWDTLASVLDHMLDRLRAGTRADLLEMAQIAYVKGPMARILWENGLKSVRALAEAAPTHLVPILMQAGWHQAEGLVPRFVMDEWRIAQALVGATEKVKKRMLGQAEVIVWSANQLLRTQQLVRRDG